MEKLKKIEAVVENILVSNAATRSNNDILYINVCEYCSPGSSKLPSYEFAQNRVALGCPPFESVTRARRKIFEKRPELKPKVVTEARENERKVYVEYAING
jgi:hypothetical protein